MLGPIPGVSLPSSISIQDDAIASLVEAMGFDLKACSLGLGLYLIHLHG